MSRGAERAEWRRWASLVALTLTVVAIVTFLPVGSANAARLAHFRYSDLVAPGRPVDLSVEWSHRIGGTADATLLWHAPTSGGSVTSYSVTDGTRTCAPPSSNLALESCTLGGLPAGETYTLSVTATNGSGSSTNSITRFLRPDGQDITFGAIANVVFAQGPLVVSATASSGLRVTFSASGACAVSGDVVSFLQVGPCAITAFQKGDRRFAPATPVANFFSITISSATLAITGGTFADDGLPHAATATASPAVGGVTVTYCSLEDIRRCTTAEPKFPGVYRATATLQNLDYSAKKVSTTLTILPPAAILPPGLGGSITSSGTERSTITRDGVTIGSTTSGFPSGDPVDVDGVSEETLGNFDVPRSSSVSAWLALLRGSSMASIIVNASRVHAGSAAGLSRHGTIAFPNGDFPGPGYYEVLVIQSSGFVAHSTVSVLVHSTTVLVAQAVANAEGDVTLDVPIPYAWAGQHHKMLLAGAYLSTSTTASGSGMASASVTVPKSLVDRLVPGGSFIMAFVDHYNPSVAAYNIVTLPLAKAFAAFTRESTPLHLKKYKAVNHAKSAMARITGATAVLSAAAAGIAVARAAASASSAASHVSTVSGRGAASVHRGSAENIEALHHTHDRDRTHIGDSSFTWRAPGRGMVDSLSLALPTTLARYSPFAAMTASDGSYWRAAFGSLAVGFPLAGAVLGALSSEQTHGYPLPPHLPLFLAIMILGFLDAFAGLAASLVSLAGALLTGHAFALNMVISGLVLATLWFGLPVMVKKVRPYVRAHPRDFDGWWQRLADFVVGPLFAGFLAAKLVDSFSLVSGLKVGLVADGTLIGWVAAGVALVRYALVTGTIFLYPRRLGDVTPTYLPGQRSQFGIISILVRMLFAGLIAAALLGWTWVVAVLVGVFGISLWLRDHGIRSVVPAWFYRAVPRNLGKILAFEVAGTIATALIARYVHSPYWQVATLLGVMIALMLSMDIAAGLKGKDWPNGWALRLASVGLVVIVALQLSDHLIT